MLILNKLQSTNTLQVCYNILLIGVIALPFDHEICSMGPTDAGAFVDAVGRARQDKQGILVTRGDEIVGVIDVDAVAHPRNADRARILTDLVIVDSRASGVEVVVGIGDVMIGTFRPTSFLDVVERRIAEDPDLSRVIEETLLDKSRAIPASELFTDNTDAHA